MKTDKLYYIKLLSFIVLQTNFSSTQISELYFSTNV